MEASSDNVSSYKKSQGSLIGKSKFETEDDNSREVLECDRADVSEEDRAENRVGVFSMFHTMISIHIT